MNFENREFWHKHEQQFKNYKTENFNYLSQTNFLTETFNTKFYWNRETFFYDNELNNLLITKTKKFSRFSFIDANNQLLTKTNPQHYAKYATLRSSSFISFFDRHNIDIPKCFKGVRSLRRLSFDLLASKFINFLMKNGKKEKIFSILTRALFFYLKQFSIYTESARQFTLSFIMKIYTIFNIYHFKSNDIFKFNMPDTLNVISSNFYSRKTKFITNAYRFKNLLLQNLLVVHPLFHFYAYNMDKNIKKFTRTKNSKYIFVWKYIPYYKRNVLTLKLVSKALRFTNGHTFKDRFSNCLHTFHTNPQDSYVHQVNHFAHTHVFKNFKKSLLNNF